MWFTRRHQAEPKPVGPSVLLPPVAPKAEPPPPQVIEKTGIVFDREVLIHSYSSGYVRSAICLWIVADGENYFFRNEADGNLPQLPFARNGDSVTFTFMENSSSLKGIQVTRGDPDWRRKGPPPPPSGI